MKLPIVFRWCCKYLYLLRVILYHTVMNCFICPLKVSSSCAYCVYALNTPMWISKFNYVTSLTCIYIYTDYSKKICSFLLKYICSRLLRKVHVFFFYRSSLNNSIVTLNKNKSIIAIIYNIICRSSLIIIIY